MRRPSTFGMTVSSDQVEALAMLFRSLRNDPKTRTLLDRMPALLAFEAAVYRARDRARLRAVD